MATATETEQGEAGPAILSLGFRPFFLGAGLFAALAIPFWMHMFTGGPMPGLAISPRGWHVHEMIFGYAGGVLAGFLLTAMPNWTARQPLRGAGLAALFGLWVLGRLAPFVFPAVIAAVIDSAFLVVLAAYAWRQVTAAKNWRNAPVCGLITLLAAANIGHHVGLQIGLPLIWERAGLGVIAVLITVIGGRITPAFTRNWMASRGIQPLPAAFGTADRAAIIATVAVLAFWIVAPASVVAGVMLLILGALQFLRLSRWRGWQTLSEPLVTILHIGYGWLPASFLLLGLTALDPALLTPSAALHGLTAGAIGTMTLAVMTRATRGHTGRALTADGRTVVIYVLVVAGAVLRVLAELLGLGYGRALALAGGMWSLGFLLFVLVYGPMLLRWPVRDAE